MKSISIVCYDNGKAKLTTEDLHLSNENRASELEIDFSNTSYPDENKWVDISVGDTSLRYDLGFNPVVNLELTYAVTLPGEMIITPFVYDGDIKVKYKTDYSLIIKYQKEAGSWEDTVGDNSTIRDDYIAQLKTRIDELETRVTTLENLKEE